MTRPQSKWRLTVDEIIKDFRTFGNIHVCRAPLIRRLRKLLRIPESKGRFSFYLYPWCRVDGHTFAKSVAGQGTKAIIVEEPVEVPEDVTVIQVKDSRYAMALVAAAYYDYPGDKLRVSESPEQKEKPQRPTW